MDAQRALSGPLLIERLRAHECSGACAAHQAADEIERLRDLIDRFGDWNMQKALEASDEAS